VPLCFACSTWPHAQPALSHSHLGAPQAARCQLAAQESPRATPSCWTGRAPKGRVQACLQVQGVEAAQAAERVPGLEHDLNELLLVRRGRLVQLQPQLRAAGSARGFSNSGQRALREPGVRRGAHPEVKGVHLAEIHLQRRLDIRRPGTTAQMLLRASGMSSIESSVFGGAAYAQSAVERRPPWAARRRPFPVRQRATALQADPHRYSMQARLVTKQMPGHSRSAPIGACCQAAPGPAISGSAAGPHTSSAKQCASFNITSAGKCTGTCKLRPLPCEWQQGHQRLSMRSAYCYARC